MQGIADAGSTAARPSRPDAAARWRASDVAGQARPAPARPPRSWWRCSEPAEQPEAPPKMKAEDVHPARSSSRRPRNWPCRSTTMPRCSAGTPASSSGGVRRRRLRQAAPQLEDGVDVLIGTPGPHHRLLQAARVRHAPRRSRCSTRRTACSTSASSPTSATSCGACPAEQRQSMLFSATLSQRVLELAYEHMNSPELIQIEPEKITVDRVRQVIYYPAMDEKDPLLVGLLRAWTPPHDGVRQHQAAADGSRTCCAPTASTPRRSRRRRRTSG